MKDAVCCKKWGLKGRGVLSPFLFTMIIAFAVLQAFNAEGSSGYFIPTGSMSSVRYAHTATLLSNGKVLIVGGMNDNSDLSSAEIYDPISHTFSYTGSMGTPRHGHTATLLNNGKVLITGGMNGSSILSSAELYDPVAGTFTATGNMNSIRSAHTATLLLNGKVMITGGIDWTSWATANPLSSAELYDPFTGTFASITGGMHYIRAFHTATRLNDGKVLISGGQGVANSSNNTAEIYDQNTGAFTEILPMQQGRHWFTATLLQNGKVLVAGGRDDYLFPNILNSPEIFDPETLTFQPTGSMSIRRAYHVAILLLNGDVLVLGGANNDSGLLTFAELYNSDLGVFASIGNMGSVRTSVMSHK